MKRNGITWDCRHTFSISVTDSSVCICCFPSSAVIEFNLYVTSLLKDDVVVVLLEGKCLSVCSIKEALWCVNPAVL